jgi:hypothetical protein
MELDKNSSKIFEFKGLIRKIFRNKDLSPKNPAKNGFGAASGYVLLDGTRNCPNRVTILSQDEA